MTSDARDGTMTGVTGDLPPLQAKTFGIVPVKWSPMPPTGVHEAIVRSLTDRGLVEIRWSDGGPQWRRKDT